MTSERTRRLGRGLSALLGDSVTLVDAGEAAVQTLPIEALEPSPFQPRRDLDPTALEELAASITYQGILQPLLVREAPGKAGAYQIIAGERRWRAAQLARLHEVPVLVRPLSDTEAMAAGLVENLQRTDLNPVEEAMGYQRLLQEFQMTQEKLAEAIGKSRAHIGNVLRLLTLPESVLALLRKGSLSFGHARALLTHPDPAALAARVARENLSVRELERLASSKPVSEPSAAARPEHDAETAALERALSEKLGLNVRITFNGRSGSLTVSYRSLDQLDELLALLNA